jgi:hypothetical protein
MSIIRQVIESPLVQGDEEQIVYSIRTTPWGAAPSNVSVKGYDVTGGAYTDVTSTILSGAAAVAGDVITLPVVKSMTQGKVYKIEVYFESGSQKFECYFLVECER